ncbi:hypothetical protein [Winogradskyella sp.]|jgi:hypothetical protein|uniref:hypothetical protein n=1 Tax=Winogradskyella sp. TaxID=1883156 RepID=UPI0025E6BD3F|nr:hypothetical protein [Winogradskyella sp.]MCT4629633.1 hypothetical protein [Winogradskyella sp.]
MEYIFLFIFLILFAVFVIFSKSDLYAHQHDAAHKKELENFNSNYKALEELDVSKNNYKINNNHLYQ